jgi:hypothetical protein
MWPYRRALQLPELTCSVYAHADTFNIVLESSVPHFIEVPQCIIVGLAHTVMHQRVCNGTADNFDYTLLPFTLITD